MHLDALEALLARDVRQPRGGQRAVAADQKLGGDGVATVGLDVPAPVGLVPLRPRHAGGEQGLIVDILLLGDGVEVGLDLRAADVLLARHELEPREVGQVWQQRRQAGCVR